MRCRRIKTSEREERVRVLLLDGVVRDSLTAETTESRGREDVKRTFWGGEVAQAC